MTAVARDLDRDVAGAASAHQRLLASLDAALEGTDLDPSGPSALPGWSRGHVLTHLARNADSCVRLLDGLPQYEHGPEGRAADIETGSDRPLRELVADVRRSIWRLETRWAEPVEWDAESELVTRAVIPRSAVPFRRWREVEVHHADLDIGYSFSEMPGEYVRLELRQMGMLWTARRPMGLTGLPPEALAAPPHQRLAWLMGRARIDGLEPAGVF